ncbi:hypothetical protein C1645_828333 [Glomus cerebriforme]|uniref:Galactose oxidase n=1 Tax=Glomus cerebriforme TaxID=658196 RepID=A0A397SLM2_9GLOM|nr:hypothetical protein C1645_828333 [Glomus cerebriforme]
MSRLIFYVFLLLSSVAFSNAYNFSAYAPPSIVLDNKYFIEIEQEIRVGFRLFDASSVNKDSKTIKYQNLQYTSDPPKVKVPRVVANKDKLYLFGINGNDFFETTVMFSFDINERIWRELKDINMPSHLSYNQEEQFVGPDSSGNAYLLYNDNNVMLTFNTETLKWNEYTIQSFVLTGYAFYSWYSATILPDGRIIYIGGRFGDSTGTNYVDAQMNQVYVYDTTTNNWSTQATSGTVPGPRNSHSASLTSDGRIIVYGGVTANNIPSDPSLVVLDTTNYAWSSPQVTNPIGSVWLAPSVIIDNSMFLYVGINSTTSVWYAFNKVFMLDTSTYTWNALDPVAIDDNENIYSNGNHQISDGINSMNKGDPLTIILIIVLIVISSIFILMLAGVTFYKWYQVKYHPQPPNDQKLSHV